MGNITSTPYSRTIAQHGQRLVDANQTPSIAYSKAVCSELAPGYTPDRILVIKVQKDLSMAKTRAQSRASVVAKQVDTAKYQLLSKIA